MNMQIVPHMVGIHNASYTQAHWHARAVVQSVVLMEQSLCKISFRIDLRRLNPHVDCA